MRHPGWRGDALAALILAFLMAAAWAFRDWTNLSALRLPDTDDAMRLQQIRDWLDGQAFADLSQHRLGAAPGLAMHWSRLPDIVPGAIIWALTPIAGRHAAEIAAIISWPAMLMATMLWLVARTSRAMLADIADAATLNTTARTATIIAAIAYPATALFVPGRIDHHGLQLVLMLVAVHALVALPSLGRGLAIGLASAASVAVGLETLPMLAAIGVILCWHWLHARPGADDRMMGFGIALAAGLLAAKTFLRTEQWGYPACDGFTAIAWHTAQPLSFVPIILAIAGHASRQLVPRVMIAGAVAAFALLGPFGDVRACLNPYGNVDPLLARLWLANVAEAQPLFAAPLPVAFAQSGLMMAGIAASLWQWRRSRERVWAALLLLQIAALAITGWQLRGAAMGAVLAAPGLACIIDAARRRGVLAVAGAWIASAGMIYPIAAQAVTPATALPVAAVHNAGCTTPAALAAFARVPNGRLIAPVDVGAYAIPASRMTVIGAPYHRNNDGNLATFRFFTADAAAARQIARDWRVTHVAWCAGAFAGEMPGLSRHPQSVSAMLSRGKVQGWLTPVAQADGLTIFAVRAGLSAPPSAL